MKRSRYSVEQIIAAVKEADAGRKVSEVCREMGITPNTFYRWKAKYGGLEVGEGERLKALEEENRRLKQLVADLSLDNQALKAVVGKKW
jgi:putative transposase